MEQEKQEAPVQGKKKRLSTPLLIFIILMAVTAVLCTIVAGIWLHGRSSLRNGGSAPTVTPGGTEQLDSYTVLHDGKYYRYKEHMVNLLLIGVDSDNKPAAPLPYGSDNQADVILVAALDTDANKMTLNSVSRDTMCDIGVPDDTGEISGVAHTQLACPSPTATACMRAAACAGRRCPSCFTACSSTAAPPFTWAASGGSTTPWAASPSTCWTTIPSPTFPGAGICTPGRT